MGELWLTNKKSKNYGQDWVQKYWENELVQFSLRPMLKKLLSNAPQGLRILEFGIETLPSFELLTHIPLDGSQLGLEKKFMLNPPQVKLFMGLSGEYSQVEQGNDTYCLDKNVRFIKHQFTTGLGIIGKAEPAFDIYFSTQGILSQLQPEQFRKLLTEIALHAKSGSVIVLDFLAKYGFKTKKRWTTEIQPHLWCNTALKQITNAVQDETGVRLNLTYQYDRAILVPSKRPYLNQLFQKDVRTDLENLKIDVETLPNLPMAALQENLYTLAACWNLLLDYAQQRFKQEIDPKKDIQGWENLPQALQFGLMTLDRLCHDTAWIAYGDRRANILEPHIAYVLRSLEYELQQGLGLGSELSWILEVEK